MPDSRNPLSWAAYAEEDYQTALDILEKHPRNAVYCFEQAAEKYLKSLLLKDSVVPRSHDLPQLLLLIDPEFDLQSRVMKAAQLLTESQFVDDIQAIYPNQISRKPKRLGVPQLYYENTLVWLWG
jgi:HEPN domain-containing protein